jgi:hypothetical protein
MTPEDRSRRLEDAHLLPPPVVCGLELRPLSPASFVLLKRLKNPLVIGGMATIEKDGVATVDFTDPENLTAILEFIYVHSAPLNEVLANARDTDLMDSAVLYFGTTLKLSEVAECTNHIISTLDLSSAAMAEAKSAKKLEDHDPNGHGPRG